MKALWNSFKIAFSMYSKIPMPRSEWTKENMRYAMCFFPLVGVAVGALMYAWSLLAFGHGAQIQPDSLLFYTAGFLVIPVLVTGGIHLDGMLDTADAMSSYQEQERRLEILKDSNSGAFAIITCVVYFILYAGAMSIVSSRALPVLCVGFVLSRSLSGWSIVTFRMAKNTGLAATFSNNAHKRTVRMWMWAYAIVSCGVMMWLDLILGCAAVAAAFAVWFYYRHMAYKNFGGITGDLAGWFLQMSELAMAVVVVVADLIVV